MQAKLVAIRFRQAAAAAAAAAGRSLYEALRGANRKDQVKLEERDREKERKSGNGQAEASRH